MADSAKEIVGIDHQHARIAVAEKTRQMLGYSNVRFKVADVRDPVFFQEMGSFDLVVAWGFFHRVPDVFSLLYNLSTFTSAFSFEWMTPVFPFMQYASVAYHPTDVHALDPTNLIPVGGLSAEEMSTKKVGGKSGYWFPTPFAIESILRKCGYQSARVLGYDEQLVSQRRAVLRQLSRVLTHRSFVTYSRVHMIAERHKGAITFKHRDFRDAGLPEWDVAGRAYMNQGH
jgi:hypothetical protein